MTEDRENIRLNLLTKVQLRFDLLKHVCTVSLAGILITLTLWGFAEDRVDADAAMSLALGCFIASLVFGIYGLLEIVAEHFIRAAFWSALCGVPCLIGLISLGAVALGL